MQKCKATEEIIHKMNRLVEQLQQQRFRTEQEKQTQEDVEKFLKMSGIQYTREHRLNHRDIPDFILDCIVLEVKTKCSRKAIYRQLERYANHPEVSGLILLTATSIGLPQKINGKPAMVASLGMGWI